MPRKSIEAERTRIVGSIGGRLPAPADLTAPERAIWVRVVDSKPADWFAEDSAPLLKEYVRAAAMCDDLAVRIRDVDHDDVRAQRALLAWRHQEAVRLTTLGTKLRLTIQSRYSARSAATADKQASGKRPWGDK